MQLPLKIYWMITSIVAIIIILQLNFTILPKLSKTLSEFSPEIGKSIRYKIYNITIIFVIFIFFFNFYFWRVDSQLEKEKRKLEDILKLNPTDSSIKKKLDEIKRKRKRYLIIAEVIFTLISGFTVGFISFLLIKPLYSFLGTLK
jgi:Kef-type K+ transport system membrane component KefB